MSRRWDVSTSSSTSGLRSLRGGFEPAVTRALPKKEVAMAYDRTANSNAIRQRKAMAMGQMPEGAPSFGCTQSGYSPDSTPLKSRPGQGTQGAVDVGSAKDKATDD